MALPTSALTMQNLISQARERQRITSNDALAKAVIQAHPELPSMKPRSLSVKIGLLDKGDTGWWKTRPLWAEALASVLMIEVTDLGLHTGTLTQTVEIREFPEFPPIDLATEDLPNLGIASIKNERKFGQFIDSDVLANWLPNQFRPSYVRDFPPSGVTWLEITDRFCSKALSATLQIKHKREIHYATDLSLVTAQLRRPQPFVIHLSRQLDADDLRPLMALNEHGAVLIMSPFPPPLREKSRFGDDRLCWEAGQNSKEERALMSLTSKFGFTGIIKHFIWQLNTDWRIDLLVWIEKRSAHLSLNSLINIPKIHEWLSGFDVHGHLFSQSSDILSLARLCHHGGEKVLPNSIEVGAGEKLLEKLRPAFNSRNLGVMRRLVKARWLQFETPWKKAMDWEEWRYLINQSRGPIIEKLTDFDLEAAVKAEILSEDANGLFEFATPMHASLLARDMVKSAIDSGDIEIWGTAALDEQRREIVDTVIDALPTVALALVVDRLPTTDPWSPASIGAEETLFLTLSRRAWTGELRQSTVDRILNAMRTRDSISERIDIPRLWSRPYSDELDEWQWMQICWHWSIGTNCPNSFRINEITAAYFPGWSEKPTWPAVLPKMDNYERYTSPPREWKEFMHLATDLSKNFSPPEWINCSKVSSEPLFALTLAWEGQWKPQKEWWEHLVFHQWAEELLLNMVSSGDKEAAEWLWPSFISALISMKEKSFVMPCLSKVWQWIMSTLSPAEILEGRSDQELAYLCACAPDLPPGIRVHLLNTLSAEWCIHVNTLIDWCPEQSCEVLIRWIDACGWLSGIAEKIWTSNPNYALTILEDKDALSTNAAQMMIHFAPSEYAYKIATILCNRLDLLDRDERILWVKNHLCISGRQAAHILSVIRKIYTSS